MYDTSGSKDVDPAKKVEGGGLVCDPTFSSWGCGVSPPSGVQGPEANAFWQQFIENWLKIGFLGRCLQKNYVTHGC